MRFCLQETSCEQEDYFPPSIAVKVNGKICPLPVSNATCSTKFGQRCTYKNMI